MNGPHDMGGFTAFGPVVAEADEPVFHAEWERRAFATVLAIGGMGMWNIDLARQARERIPALAYWRSNYYEIWLVGMRRLLLERGLVTAEELAEGTMKAPPLPVKQIVRPEMVAPAVARGGPASRPLERVALFKPGDNVRTRNINPASHTRLPRYARGKAGEVVRVHGSHVFPDSSAAGLGDDPQWLYSVRFSSHELWGNDSRDSVYIDLWEPYLDPR